MAYSSSRDWALRMPVSGGPCMFCPGLFADWESLSKSLLLPSTMLLLDFLRSRFVVNTETSRSPFSVTGAEGLFGKVSMFVSLAARNRACTISSSDLELVLVVAVAGGLGAALRLTYSPWARSPLSTGAGRPFTLDEADDE